MYSVCRIKSVKIWLPLLLWDFTLQKVFIIVQNVDQVVVVAGVGKVCFGNVMHIRFTLISWENPDECTRSFPTMYFSYRVLQGKNIISWKAAVWNAQNNFSSKVTIWRESVFGVFLGIPLKAAGIGMCISTIYIFSFFKLSY